MGRRCVRRLCTPGLIWRNRVRREATDYAAAGKSGGLRLLPSNVASGIMRRFFVHNNA